MKKRYAPGLFLFLATFGFLVSCDRSLNRFQEKQLVTAREQTCMDRVIAVDDSIGKIRNKETKALPLSQTITQYTAKMKAIPTADCPKEFSKAFSKHIAAWDDLLEVTDKYPDMRGEMHDLFKQLEKSKDSAQFRKLKNAVWDTWDVIELTAK